MARFRVQHGDDLETIDEEKLRKKLRSKDLSGLELVRREDAEEWVPLCETEIFRQEVPFRGDPLVAARRRQVQGFMGHLTGWLIVAGIMGALGSWFPFWLLIWGVFVAVHAAKVAPSALSLVRAGSLLGPPAPAALEPAGGPSRAIAPPTEPGSPFTQQVAEVRALLARRGGEHAERLARQVEQLVATLREITRRRADLESQLSADVLDQLMRAREEADRRLNAATTDQDRALLQQELDAVEQRHDAVEQAQRTVERLRSRERLAGHQLEQLRLDLSRAEAQGVDVPDLADQLEDIRLETSAIEEVEEALAKSDRGPPAG